MSNSVKKVTESSSRDNVSDRLRDSLNLDVNKPDFRDTNLLKTPGSPLRSSSGGGLGSSTTSSSGFTTSTTTTTSTTSSSSSSSESVSVSGSGANSGSGTGSDKVRSNVRVKKVVFDETVKSYSGSGSSESSPTSRGGSTRSGSSTRARTSSFQQPQQPMRGGSGGGSTKSPPSPSSFRSGSGGGSTKSPSSPSSFRSGTGGGSTKSPPSPSSFRSGTGGGSTKSPSSPSSVKSGIGGSVKSPSSPSSPSPPTSPRIILPAGNICPHGVVKTGMASNSKKTDTLGPGTGDYGHGSLMRAGAVAKKFSESTAKAAAIAYGNDPEELKRLGNVEYKKGKFDEALRLYDRAISLIPTNVSYKANRAAALTGLGRLHEALKECQEAIKLDPAHMRSQQRLGSLLFRFGQVEDARMHLRMSGQQATPEELTMWHAIDKHISRCVNGRKCGDWKNVIKECDAAIASGADHCPELLTCRAEALVKLHQLDDAVAVLSRVPKYELSNYVSSSVPRFGMLFEAYYLFVGAQIDLAFGRFETAITTAESAEKVDPRSADIVTFLKNVRLVSRARTRGNELFKSERLTEASYAYGEGLRLDPSNAVLYCNRAACSFKIGQWEKSIEDCNQALKIQPKYVKALLRRAASNCKLERLVDAVKDYEILRKEIPDDNEVAKSLFRAQVALKKSRGEEVSNMKFGGEVEQVSTPDQFKAAISWPGVTVVHFKAQSHPQCEQISPFFDTLCERYPLVNFVMVDIEASPAIASLENVGIVPTFKIFRNGKVVKEMICPNQHSLETSVRHYST